ncbi:MAG: PCRF domain-containing protein, partial [Synergistaceae bacterium]|nr:PCRF domain-containing protein [Synergistaceae bacterium]
MSKITSSPDFWTTEGHEETLKELSQITSKIDGWKSVRSEYDELCLIEEMLNETDDQELESEFFRRSSDLRSRLEHESLLSLMNDTYDSSNAIMIIHSGSGGLDSQDWAGMLMRMYLRYFERENFSAKVIE